MEKLLLNAAGVYPDGSPSMGRVVLEAIGDKEAKEQRMLQANTGSEPAIDTASPAGTASWGGGVPSNLIA